MSSNHCIALVSVYGVDQLYSQSPACPRGCEQSGPGSRERSGGAGAYSWASPGDGAGSDPSDPAHSQSLQQ